MIYKSLLTLAVWAFLMLPVQAKEKVKRGDDPELG